MSRVLIALTIIAFLCFTFACQQGERVLVEPKADAQADIQDIKDIIAEMNASANTSDFARGTSRLADDAIEIPPNKPANIGKEAIRGSMQQMFQRVTLQEKDDVKDIRVSENLAVAHVAYTASFTNKESGESDNVEGNWLLVFAQCS